MITFEQALKRAITRAGDNQIIPTEASERVAVYIHPERWQDLADSFESRGNRPYVIDRKAVMAMASSIGIVTIFPDKVVPFDGVRIDVTGIVARHNIQLEGLS